MGMTLASGLVCRIEMNRLGRLRKFDGALRSLTADGGEIFAPESIPAGQRLKVSLDASAGESFDLIAVACQAEGLEGYRVKLRLAAGTWPYQLYSRLAAQASAPVAVRRATPTCLRDLGLEKGCTAEDVEAAFARLVRKCHPDRGGTVDEFVRVRRAYLDALTLLGARR